MEDLRNLNRHDIQKVTISAKCLHVTQNRYARSRERVLAFLLCSRIYRVQFSFRLPVKLSYICPGLLTASRQIPDITSNQVTIYSFHTLLSLLVTNRLVVWPYISINKT
jgi:hypothetical protein